MHDLQGKVAVVTGAARRIGLTIARTLAGAGAAVVLSDVVDGDAAAAEIRSSGGQALYRRADVTRPEDMAALAAATTDAYGRLDIWVNNAKVDARASVTELALEEWNAVLSVCLTGAFLGAKHAIPAMIASGGGAILNIASVHAVVAYPQCPAYDAAKAGLVALTRQIAAEYGPDNIRANAILPGLIVDLPADELAPPWVRAMQDHYPMGRVGASADVAAAVLYLASDGARFVTGAALVVDGGMTARSPEWVTHGPYRGQRERSDT